MNDRERWRERVRDIRADGTDKRMMITTTLQERILQAFPVSENVKRKPFISSFPFF